MSTQWIPELQPNEFPGGTDTTNLMSPDLFHYCIFPLRERSGVPMTPSEVVRAHVRLKDSDKGSMHYAGGESLSRASDLFVANRHVAKVYNTALKIESIGGFGLYFDTLRKEVRTMFHADDRNGNHRVLWVRDNGVYTYFHHNPIRYYEVLTKCLKRIGAQAI